MSLTELQMERRKTRFTASTGPSFLGYNPYESPHAAWERHLGLSEPPENAFTSGGHDFEEAIAAAARHVKPEWWEGRKRPRVLVGSGKPDDDTLIDPQHDWLCATPDFIFTGEHGGESIQVKNHEPRMMRSYQDRPGALGEWDNALVPAQYMLQCQLEMIVLSGVTKIGQLLVYLTAHFGGARPRVYRIRRDERLQVALLKAGYEFWLACIDKSGPRLPPDPARWPWRARAGPEPRRTPKLDRAALLMAPVPELPMSEIDLGQPFGE